MEKQVKLQTRQTCQRETWRDNWNGSKTLTWAKVGVLVSTWHPLTLGAFGVFTIG